MATQANILLATLLLKRRPVQSVPASARTITINVNVISSRVPIPTWTRCDLDTLLGSTMHLSVLAAAPAGPPSLYRYICLYRNETASTNYQLEDLYLRINAWEIDNLINASAPLSNGSVTEQLLSDVNTLPVMTPSLVQNRIMSEMFRASTYRQVYLVPNKVRAAVIESNTATPMPMVVGDMEVVQKIYNDNDGNQLGVASPTYPAFERLAPLFVGPGNSSAYDCYVAANYAAIARLLSSSLRCAYVDQSSVLCTYDSPSTIPNGPARWEVLGYGMLLVLEDYNLDLVPFNKFNGSDSRASRAAARTRVAGGDVQAQEEAYKQTVAVEPMAMERITNRRLTSVKRGEIADYNTAGVRDLDVYNDLSNGLNDDYAWVNYGLVPPGELLSRGNNYRYSLREVKEYLPPIRGFSVDMSVPLHVVQDVVRATRMPRITTNM